MRRALAVLALAAAVASLLAVALAIWGVRSERLGWRFAMHGLLGAVAPIFAAVALSAGVAATAVAFAAIPGGRGALPPALSALLGASVLIGVGLWRAQLARRALISPALHDVATDWRDPLMPTPALLRLRGVDAAPIEAAPSLGEGPRGGFLGRPVAEVNARTCPQARPLILALPMAAAYARLEATVARSGLRIVTDDAASGVLEAQASAPVAYGGHADVLARVRPEGQGARIDLRSISRYGAVDGGTNCRRITALRAVVASG